MPRVLALAAVLLAASAVVRADPPPADPVKAFRQAEELSAADQPAKAEPLYRVAINSGEPFIKRRAYQRLMALYARSGRPDKAVQLAGPFRAWLKEVRDPAGESELDVTLGECYLGLGHYATAEGHFAAALAPGRPAAPDVRLQALRGRAEVATRTRAADAGKRWADLEAAAADTARTADRLADTPLRVRAARFLADALHHRGATAAALATLEPVPGLCDKLNDPFARRDVQQQRAQLYAAAGKYAAAAPLFREALDLHRKYRPNRRLPAGDILAEWSVAAAAAGQKDEVARLRSEAEAEYRAVLNTAAADAADGGPLAAFVKLQVLARSARDFRKALELSRGPGERWAGDVLLEVRMKADRGGLELLASSYQTARAQLTTALAELDKADPPDLKQLPQVLVSLATAELAGDTPARADPLLARCAGLYRTHKLPDDAVLAQCDYLRGVAAAQAGDFARAVRFFRSGLAICSAVGAPAEPVRFTLLLNTALVHKEQGDYDIALDHLAQASGVLKGFAAADDLSFGLIEAVRADLHISQGDVPPAMALVPGIEAACERHGVRGGYLWTTAKHVRALDLLARKQTKEAEAVWADLAATQRAEGQVLLARTLNYLGIAAESQGRPADALKRYEEARDFQAARPWCPPVTRGITLWRLAVLSDKAGHKDEAKRLLVEVFDVADRARLNTFGGAGQRAQFFAQFNPAYELLARWHARDGEGDALLRVITRSRSRTLLDQVLAAGVDPRESLAGPDRDKLLARESAARQAVSRARAKAQVLPADKPDDPAVKSVLADLDAAQQEFADAWREIVNADPVTRGLTDPADAEKALAQLRAAPGGAKTAVLAYLIGRAESFAVLAPGDGKPAEVFRLGAPELLAKSIADAPPAAGGGTAGLRGIAIRPLAPQPDRPPPFEGKAVPLTEAVAGRLVDQYLRQVADPNFTATRGIAIVSKNPQQKTLPAPGELLGEMVLPAALRDRVRSSGATRLVVVPDGPLHKVPLECVLISGGPNPRYALDELPAVSYVPSLGVLGVVASRPRAPAGPPKLLTVGDPAYREDPAPPPTATASREVMGFRGTLPRLPFTAEETRRVRALFPADAVTSLEGTAATERNVVAALAGERYVHIAAHGFADDRFGNLFAAVALAPPPGGAVSPDDDGFLSLHEIHRLKLTGCELTVLSACVTSVGPQRPLEAGVTLAGGFLCAGSRRVVASCWSVDDRATAELMAVFFGGVRPGGGSGSCAEALRAARLRVRGTPGWESPFYWAPFVCLGPPD